MVKILENTFFFCKILVHQIFNCCTDVNKILAPLNVFCTKVFINSQLSYIANYSSHWAAMNEFHQWITLRDMTIGRFAKKIDLQGKKWKTKILEGFYANCYNSMVICSNDKRKSDFKEGWDSPSEMKKKFSKFFGQFVCAPKLIIEICSF